VPELRVRVEVNADGERVTHCLEGSAELLLTVAVPAIAIVELPQRIRGPLLGHLAHVLHDRELRRVEPRPRALACGTSGRVARRLRRGAHRAHDEFSEAPLSSRIGEPAR